MSAPQLCRICRGKSDPGNEINESLKSKITHVLGIIVQNDDDERTLCSVCEKKIEEFYEFKVMSEGTETQYGRKPMVLGSVKVKPEPVDDDDSIAKPHVMPMPHYGPNFPNGVIFPHYVLDSSGNYVPVPAMVPVGNPIPLSSLTSAGVGSLPIVHPSAIHPSSLQGSTKSNGDITSVKIKEERKSPPVLTREEPLSQNGGSTPLSNCDPAISSTSKADSSESSEELQNVDDIIDAVQTDKEDESSKSSSNSKSSSDDKGKHGSQSKKTCPTSTVKSKSIEKERSVDKSLSDVSGSAVKNKKQGLNSPAPDSGEGSSSPPSARAKRGRKRRGSGLGQFSGRRTRSKTCETTPKPSETDDDAPLSKRFTRSSTGMKPRRKIVDSSSDDGDFNPDDPDDPQDPDFTTLKKRKSKSSSSSSDTSEVSDSEPEKKKIPKTPPKPIPYIGRNQREEPEMKHCPHCPLKYKHWVSYDDHVKECAAKKEKLEKEGLDKGSEKEKAEEEEDKTEVKCIVCLKYFEGKKALKLHMATHQPKRGPPYECKICHETFEEKGPLICHNALKHRSSVSEPILKPEKKKYHCSICKEDFENSGDLICHSVLSHKKK